MDLYSNKEHQKWKVTPGCCVRMLSVTASDDDSGKVCKPQDLVMGCIQLILQQWRALQKQSLRARQEKGREVGLHLGKQPRKGNRYENQWRYK